MEWPATHGGYELCDFFFFFPSFLYISMHLNDRAATLKELLTCLAFTETKVHLQFSDILRTFSTLQMYLDHNQIRGSGNCLNSVYL